MADFNYKVYLASREWAVLKEKVRARSKGWCERCIKGDHEDTHHTTYERIGRERLDDLLGVCRACHEFLSGKSSVDPRDEVGKKLRGVGAGPAPLPIFSKRPDNPIAGYERVLLLAVEFLDDEFRKKLAATLSDEFWASSQVRDFIRARIIGTEEELKTVMESLSVDMMRALTDTASRHHQLIRPVTVEEGKEAVLRLYEEYFVGRCEEIRDAIERYGPDKCPAKLKTRYERLVADRKAIQETIGVGK